MTTHPHSIVRVGVLATVDLDPRTTQDWLSALVLRQIFETPFSTPDPGLGAQPEIFDGSLTNGLEPRGRLRRDLRFSDGTKVTPAHVVTSLSSSEAFRETADVSADGDRIIFRPKKKNARFDLALSHQCCAILLEKDGQLLGSGPYMLARDSTPACLRLVKNPYYRTPVAVDEIEIKVYPPDRDGKPRRLLEALQNGECDLTNVLSRQDLQELRGLRTWLEPGNSTAILFFNTERPFLRHAQARKAIASALDRTAFAEHFFGNPHAFKALGLMPPNLGTWRDRLYPNPTEARALVSSVEDPVPDVLSLCVMPQPRPYLPKPRLAAEFLVDKLADLGMQVKIEIVETLEEYDQRIRVGSYDLFLSGWIADTPDPADFVESILASKLIPQITGSVANRSNLSRWNSSAMDSALALFREQSGEDSKTEINRLLKQDVPLFPLLYGWTAAASSWRIHQCKFSALGIPIFASMTLKA